MRRQYCTYCNSEAITRVPERGVKLCRDHFVQFFETEIENVVERYQMLQGVRRLLIAVSGGKDSVALLHVLRKISERRGIDLVGATIDLGIEGYSEHCVEISRRHYERLGVPYLIVKLEDYGFTIDKAKKYEKSVRPVCSVCGLVKRYLLNKVALELNCDAIATGHNLVDVAQYMVANFLSGSLDALLKLRPVTRGEDLLVTRVRPFFFMHERYIELYVNILGLEYVSERCPYSMRGAKGRDMPFQEYLRTVLLELDLRYPGTLYRSVHSFVRNVLPVLERLSVRREERVGRCAICGMPTQEEGRVCAFCKIRDILSKAN